MPGVCQSYKHEVHRIKKRKTFADETTDGDVGLSGSHTFKVDTFNVTIDNLVSCLVHRLDAYKHINSLFGVLFMSDAEYDSNIITGAHNLSSAYPDDLNSCLADELIQFRSFISMKPDRSPSKMLKTIIDYGLPSVSPNVYVALKLFLTLPVSNCEGERSFALMAREKK